jgi:imidazole glycerol phosphate synthase subunit HisF
LSPVLKAGVDGIAIADALHYNKFSIIEIKKKILELGYDVRINE